MFLVNSARLRELIDSTTLRPAAVPVRSPVVLVLVLLDSASIAAQPHDTCCRSQALCFIRDRMPDSSFNQATGLPHLPAQARKSHDPFQLPAHLRWME